MVLASKQTSEAALGCQTASTLQHWLMASCFRMGCNVRLTVLGHISVHDCPRSSYLRMSTANGFGIRSNVEGRKICRQHGERRRDNKVVMAASRLQMEPASRARLENELTQFAAQKLTPGRLLGDSQGAAPHGQSEPLEQPRLANNQAVSLSRSGNRAVAADQADADVRRCSRQQFRGGVAEAALIEDEEVEAGEVRCNEGELLTQRSLRQAQCSRDGEPAGFDVEEHEGAVVAPAGEIEAGNQLQTRQTHKTSARHRDVGR